MNSPRGQAVLELSLVLPLFAAGVLGLLYFAEVGALSVKVQGAANSAVWEASGKPLHDVARGDWTLGEDAVRQASIETDRRYRDWDGRSAVTKPRQTLRQVVVEGSDLRVDCEVDRTLPQVRIPSVARGALPESGLGLTCAASAQLTPVRIPSTFLGATFLALPALRVCSSGRPVGGSCQGRFGVLLDDWGLSGAEEARECRLAHGAGCANPGYYRMVSTVYGNNGGGGSGAGSALVQAVVGVSSPADERRFFFSFRGSESGFQERLPISHGDNTWYTSPFQGAYGASFARRDCLGTGSCASWPF